MKSTKQSTRIPFMLPCVVNVRNLPREQIDALVGSMVQDLGAKFFRDKELFMAVLDDYFEAARQPRAFLYGPFIKLTKVPSGDLRITACDAMVGGDACYAIDQLREFIDSRLAGEQLGYESSSSLGPSPGC
ncbi:TPA: hypothetical protein ACQQ5N_002817 [Pseudomonas aeruginosa]|nr:MAG: hypothetical protein VR76_01535 [Pseudomonas sp. BRH_c35]MBN0172540.1 hypothetical protein [Pseudomonas aeruginosa]